MFQLLEKDELAQYEPSLKGLRPECGGYDFDPYEFDITILDFVTNGFQWIHLGFGFKKEYCMMYVNGHWPETENKSHLISKFESIDVEPLFMKDFSRDISWQEADEIIMKYLKTLETPPSPK